MLYKVTGAGHSVRACVRVCVCEWVCVVCGVWCVGAGGGGSEFSVAWCKRGGGREGVQLPDSLVDEAVLQSVGPGLETPQSPP